MAVVYDQETNKWYDPAKGKPEPEPLTECHKCGQVAVRHREEAYGDYWTCESCGNSRYYSLGD